MLIIFNNTLLHVQSQGGSDQCNLSVVKLAQKQLEALALELLNKKSCSETAALLTLVRVRAVGAEGGAHTVHAYPLPLSWAALGGSTTASPQQLQLALEVPLLTLQRLQLVLALPVCLFKFLTGESEGGDREKVNYVYQGPG